jgi:hypothetical protein
MMMIEIQSKVDVVKQAGRPVEQYSSQLQYLWGGGGGGGVLCPTPNEDPQR